MQRKPVGTRKVGRPITTQDARDTCRELLKQGSSLKHAREASGLYKTAVTQIAKELGIKTNAPSKATIRAKKRATRLLEKGEPPVEVAKKTGLYMRAVRELSAELGVADQRAEAKAERIAEGRKMRADGMSLREVADHFGVAKSTVSRWGT